MFVLSNMYSCSTVHVLNVHLLYAAAWRGALQRQRYQELRQNHLLEQKQKETAAASTIQRGSPFHMLSARLRVGGLPSVKYCEVIPLMTWQVSRCYNVAVTVKHVISNSATFLCFCYSCSLLASLQEGEATEEGEGEEADCEEEADDNQ